MNLCSDRRILGFALTACMGLAKHSADSLSMFQPLFNPDNYIDLYYSALQSDTAVQQTCINQI